jgi:hypothetical protein
MGLYGVPLNNMFHELLRTENIDLLSLHWLYHFLIMCFYHVLVKLQSRFHSSCQHLSIFAWLIMLDACKLLSSPATFL